MYNEPVAAIKNKPSFDDFRVSIGSSISMRLVNVTHLHCKTNVQA